MATATAAGWTEESELRPTSQRGSRRARAEAQWLSLFQSDKLPVEIFRLAGIYGPGRSALDSVRAGNARRIDKPGHAFSRVHVADIVQVLRASMQQPNPGRIFAAHAEDIARLPSLQWLGYLSSTAVYGDRDGGWVDEESELRPTSKRGSRRARAEAQWLSLFRQETLPVEIFRLAGIYGPKADAAPSTACAPATPVRIDKPGHAFSRIHVADIVQVLRASMRRPNPGRIYNVCDDEAAPSHKLIGEAECRMLGIEPFDRSFPMTRPTSRRSRAASTPTTSASATTVSSTSSACSCCIPISARASPLVLRPKATGQCGPQPTARINGDAGSAGRSARYRRLPHG